MKRIVATLSVIIGFCLSSWAANTFTAVTGNDWNTPGNWSGGVPTAGQDVIIDGDVSLTNSTAALASLTVNVSRTLTFNGWDTVLHATNVAIYGTMTHAINGDMDGSDGWTPNARVNIDCDTLNIHADGRINVDVKGYQGGYKVTGYGPGRGEKKTQAGGGGYGGIGGGASDEYGQMYGSYLEPSEPGSGGGGSDISSAGGGCVRIVATDSVTIDGSILANGGNTSGNYKGTGSGGGVYISCKTILGSGSVVANGGYAGSWTASGGGGRIAVIYDIAEQAAVALPSIWFSAAAGGCGSTSNQGDVGTLYFPDNQFLLRQTGAIKHSGVWMAPGLAEWRRDSLAMENAWIRIPEDGLVVEVTNNLSIVGADASLSRLELTNATVSCGGSLTIDKSNLTLQRGVDDGTALSVAGDAIVKNSGVVHVYGGMTGDINVPGSTVNVVGDITVTGTGSWIYPYSHPTNGGAVRFTARNVFVSTAGAGFDASGRGYAGGVSGGAGYGPGAGRGAAASGAGYGGFGANAMATSGQTNGLASYPVGSGSGGGSAGTDSNSGSGGAGGGVIWILAEDTVQVNGSLLADGAIHTMTYSGAGSGGGIYIECDKIIGVDGVISAKGGLGNSYGGLGGGGRIAVIYNPTVQSTVDVPSIFFNAAIPAYSSNVKPGTIGSLYFPDSQFLTRTDVVRQSGRWEAPGMPDPWLPDSLILNESWLHILVDGFSISTTGSVSIVGTSKLVSKLELDNGQISADSGVSLKTSTLMARSIVSGSDVVLNASDLIMNKNGEGWSNLDSAGDMILTNAAKFTIYGGVADGDDPYRGGEVNVGGDISITGGGWVYPWSHPTNGGSVCFRAANVFLSGNSGFDASEKGFRGGRKTVHPDGYGPGAGLSNSGGGGYGGRGGAASSTSGQTYGLAVAPMQPGSGGGNNNTTDLSDGGGFVWIETPGKVVLNDGHLWAYAVKSRNVSGGGSGGAILVDCASFSGDASSTMKADGGASGGWGYGGGGGRIAVWRGISDAQRTALLSGNAKGAEVSEAYLGFEGSVTVTPGSDANPVALTAEPGTIAFVYFPPPSETKIIIR